MDILTKVSRLKLVDGSVNPKIGKKSMRIRNLYSNKTLKGHL